MTENQSIVTQYISDHIATVLKKPVGFIRYPFIDPGSVYDGNVWDWDTYWSVYGLLPFAQKTHNDTFTQQVLEHARGNVMNFLDYQLPDGYIPMMIENGSWQEPYLTMKHRQGVLMNMHKPFLCQQICLISDFIHDYSWITAGNTPDQLESYFTCYYRDYYNRNCSLFVWSDDIMIGVDNDPASFGRPKSSTANTFLNCFMVSEMKAMEKIMRQTERTDRAAWYKTESEKLSSAIQTEMYDRRDRFFYSADVDIKTRSYDWFHKGLGVFWKTLPIKIRMWTGFLPMLTGIATSEQASFLAAHYRDTATFHCPYGITTLAQDEKMFNLDPSNNPSNWLGPVWLVANYAVFRGLLNYGFRSEAEEICIRSLELLANDIRTTGQMHEYYNPFTGVPVMNGGFINWNILALNMADELAAGEEQVTE